VAKGKKIFALSYFFFENFAAKKKAPCNQKAIFTKLNLII